MCVQGLADECPRTQACENLHRRPSHQPPCQQSYRRYSSPSFRSFHYLSRTNSSSGTRCILFTVRARTNKRLDNLLMYGSTSVFIDSTFERATILLSALLHTALATWSSAPGTLPPGSMNLRRRGSTEFNSSVTLSSLSSCSLLIRGTFAVTSSLAKSPPRIQRSLWMFFRIWSNFFDLICALPTPS